MSKFTLDQLLTKRCSNVGKDGAYSAGAIEAQLAVLPDWSYVEEAVVRSYRFKNYYETMAFVNAIAYMIHQQDHHPELNVSYNRCTIHFNTHSADGISINDFICAAHCDAVFNR